MKRLSLKVIYIILSLLLFGCGDKDAKAIAQAQKYYDAIEVPIERQCYIAIATNLERDNLDQMPYVSSYVKEGMIHVTYRRVEDSKLFTNRCSIPSVEKDKVTYLVQWLDTSNSRYNNGSTVVLNYQKNGEVTGIGEYGVHTYSYRQVWGKKRPSPLFYKDAGS